MMNIASRSAPLRKLFQSRMYHSIANSGVKATEGEKAVTVYNSPEFDSFSGASKSANGHVNSWDSQLMASPHKSKFFSLIPFHIESKFSEKSFVLKLELFPKSKFLCFHTLTLNGVQQHFVPMSEVIPITKYDYWAASWLCFMKQNTTLDLDMVYAN